MGQVTKSLENEKERGKREYWYKFDFQMVLIWDNIIILKGKIIKDNIIMLNKKCYLYFHKFERVTTESWVDKGNSLYNLLWRGVRVLNRFIGSIQVVNHEQGGEY